MTLKDIYIHPNVRYTILNNEYALYKVTDVINKMPNDTLGAEVTWNKTHTAIAVNKIYKEKNELRKKLYEFVHL
jgi:hypothetical protein